jgi:DNA mismatch repair protein MSH4
VGCYVYKVFEIAVISLQCLSDDNYQRIYRKILSVLHDDARTAKGAEASQMQCNFAIKGGISGILDLARQTYCEIVSDISGQFSSPHTIHQKK